MASISTTHEPIRIVPNVHEDDIHGLARAGSTFLSVSKDTSLKHWTKDGDLIRTISIDRNPNYTKWITGLDVFKKDLSWVIGARNGFLKCGALRGRRIYYANFFSQAKDEDSVRCKERNIQRITGLRCVQDVALFHCLVGFPQSFYQFDLERQQVVRRFRFGQEAWVYGFAFISPGIIATIHGSNLSLLQEDTKVPTWNVVRKLVVEPPRARRDQAPFISSIEGIKAGDVVQDIAIAYFGGVTEIRNVERNITVHRGHEHTERVWQVVPFEPFMYASCADDATVKIWDTRLERSVYTYAGHPGRVSALCFWGNTQFVAATCPEDPATDPYKGQFYYYDVRRG